MKKKIFKDQKQKNKFLFYLLLVITLVALLIGIILLALNTANYNDQVARTRDYLVLQTDKSSIENANFNMQGLMLGKFKDTLMNVKNQAELNTTVAKIIQDNQLISTIDAPAFAYGIFMVLVGILTGLATILFGNSTFNKKYQKEDAQA
ncbi:hypothetical protein RUS47_03635 [Mycoplasmoides gallisepticum]|uniref:Uncharacterized protein n=2 Tax=Mycoplasmoides gallisepticum TaxID=2096 RepID=Q7NAI7_MYCGA|nr:hypothetical protein [Mycoplasmoides gallisepticum]AAP57019.2 hypothetical protein MGA_0512 [Mycoplasmoides gallisepticum str. R(low)]ADC30888.1 hypothetical protein MGAH_0512 [Mycoplasmoides gallisepticum str. R(high)]ADC31642.1 hypothetical protein MGF_5170 [Mycoplasmoides gallisepticum str. F]OBU78259.1 hypothetical protein BAY36_03720 [Mycoplasmoides gallisepticum]OBU78301.1 hypothetical protein BAY37_03925 [Mycoplasmoides gallisepticum]